MSLIIQESDLEKMIVSNYWEIIHENEDEPKSLEVYSQLNIEPYGIIDVIAVYGVEDLIENPSEENPDGVLGAYIEIEIVEIKITEPKEQDVAQLLRYRQAFSELIEHLSKGSNKIKERYNIRSILIGNKGGGNCPDGNKGDFVYLTNVVDEIEVLLFEFGVKGFEFDWLGSDWTSNGDKKLFLKNASEMLYRVAKKTNKEIEKHMEISHE